MFRFTIREILMLTAMVALSLAWAIDLYRLATSNHELTTQRNRVADTKAQLVMQRELLQKKLDTAPAGANDSL